MQLILASRSPRRSEILASLGVPFTVVSADADETSSISDATLLVKELALRKGRAAKALLASEKRLTEDTLILAADTVVAINERILGKPKDEEEAAEMLRMLSGRTHRVISGIALLYGPGADKGEYTAAEETTVRFSTLTDADIRRYVKSGEPMDKAGAYAVQGLASIWIEGIDGDYFSVVGLPVHCLNNLLQKTFGIGLIDLSNGVRPPQDQPWKGNL